MHPDGIPAKKRKTDLQEKILEVPENKGNPLQCPVKFYEFYLSKWFVALFIHKALLFHYIWHIYSPCVSVGCRLQVAFFGNL